MRRAQRTVEREIGGICLQRQDPSQRKRKASPPPPPPVIRASKMPLIASLGYGQSIPSSFATPGPGRCLCCTPRVRTLRGADRSTGLEQWPCVSRWTVGAAPRFPHRYKGSGDEA